MTALLTLLAGYSFWVAGIRLSHVKGSYRRSTEYWWGFSAFFFGGVGTLGSFEITALTSTQGIAIRVAPPLVLGIIMTVRIALSRSAFIPPAGLALLLFFGLLIVGESGLMPFASFLAYLPAIFIPKEGYNLDSLRAGATAGVSLALTTIFILVLLMPGAVIGPCHSAVKCTFFGFSLGTLSAGNALGMYLSAASLDFSRRWGSGSGHLEIR